SLTSEEPAKPEDTTTSDARAVNSSVTSSTTSTTTAGPTVQKVTRPGQKKIITKRIIKIVRVVNVDKKLETSQSEIKELAPSFTLTTLARTLKSTSPTFDEKKFLTDLSAIKDQEITRSTVTTLLTNSGVTDTEKAQEVLEDVLKDVKEGQESAVWKKVGEVVRSVGVGAVLGYGVVQSYKTVLKETGVPPPPESIRPEEVEFVTEVGLEWLNTF
ncbi:hypothetical protein HK102_009225, partial [Quaeritorhiza haematococci]